MTRRSPILGASAAFLAATVAMFFDVFVLTPDRIPSIPGEDIERIFLPWNAFAFGELRAGHLVLWNPHSFAGAPFFGGFAPGLLYPPNWLYMFVAPPLAFNLDLALHVFLAGLWTYLWTRHRGLHPAACTLAGLVFMFCGAHFQQLFRGHLPNLHTLIWAPLVFLAIDGVVATASLRWVLVGMAATALQFVAGNLQYAFYTALVAGPYALARSLTAGASMRVAAGLAAIYVGGASLAAIQIVSGMTALTESLRAGISYEIAATGALPPENLVTLALPVIFGDQVTVPYWGRWALSEVSLFIGIAPCVLALYAMLRGDRRTVVTHVGMAAVVLLVAFGDHTPLFAVLYAWVPGFQSVRGIAKFGVLATLFIVMLVAIGFDRLLREPAPTWLVAGMVLVSVLLGVLGLSVRGDCATGGRFVWNPVLGATDVFRDARMMFGEDPGLSLRACGQAATSLLVGGATLLVVAVVLLGSRVSPRLVHAVAVVGILEVFAYARYSRPTFDAAPALERLVEARGAFAARAESAIRIASRDPVQNVAMATGGFDVWGAGDLVLDRYARFLASTQGWPIEAVIATSGLRTIVPSLAMLRLGETVELRDGMLVFERTGLRPLPRALVVPKWKVLPDVDAVLAAIRDPAFDPRQLVLLESDPDLPMEAPAETVSVSVRDVSTESIEVHAEVDHPAILLLTDNYAADWRATAIEDATHDYAVMPANSTLRAIPLPAGRHHLRLEYRPRAFLLGARVTAIALVLFVLAAIFEWRRARSPRGSPSGP